MGKLVAHAEGSDGKISLLTDRLVVEHPGIWGMIKFGSAAHKEIPLASLTGIDFVEPTFFQLGKIHIEHAGEHCDKDKAQTTVSFQKKQLEVFERLKEKIFEVIVKNRQA